MPSPDPEQQSKLYAEVNAAASAEEEAVPQRRNSTLFTSSGNHFVFDELRQRTANARCVVKRGQRCFYMEFSGESSLTPAGVSSVRTRHRETCWRTPAHWPPSTRHLRHRRRRQQRRPRNRLSRPHPATRRATTSLWRWSLLPWSRWAWMTRRAEARMLTVSEILFSLPIFSVFANFASPPFRCVRVCVFV